MFPTLHYILIYTMSKVEKLHWVSKRFSQASVVVIVFMILGLSKPAWAFCKDTEVKRHGSHVCRLYLSIDQLYTQPTFPMSGAIHLTVLLLSLSPVCAAVYQSVSLKHWPFYLCIYSSKLLSLLDLVTADLVPSCSNPEWCWHCNQTLCHCWFSLISFLHVGSWDNFTDYSKTISAQNG